MLVTPGGHVDRAFAYAGEQYTRDQFCLVVIGVGTDRSDCALDRGQEVLSVDLAISGNTENGWAVNERDASVAAAGCPFDECEAPEAELLAGVSRRDSGLKGVGGEFGFDLFEDVLEQGFLAREVMVEGPAGDAGCCCDRVDRHRVESISSKELTSGTEQGSGRARAAFFLGRHGVEGTSR